MANSAVPEKTYRRVKIAGSGSNQVRQLGPYDIANILKRKALGPRSRAANFGRVRAPNGYAADSRKGEGR